MASPNDRRSEHVTNTSPAPLEVVPAEAEDGSVATPAGQAAREDQLSAPTTSPPGRPGQRSTPTQRSHSWGKWLLLAGAVVGLVVGACFLIPWAKTALNTVSTDDAYVNGHVTSVAPRVSGQVSQVLVDDNYR